MAKIVKPTQKCRIAEVLLHSCELVVVEGAPQVHCLPIPRIFRICPGRPAVEITKFVEINSSTGAIVISLGTSQTIPRAKMWRDVVRYDHK